ncbi:MAG: hypothetical protein AABP62_05330 [Planctomycetota bacterium]
MKTSIPSGLTPEAMRAREQFCARYEAHLRQIAHIALNILVWGPNPKNQTQVSQKRNEIRLRLIEDGHNAMFSEDIVTPALGFSQKTVESVQAKLVDLVIILVEDSPGALAEAHDFCNHPDIAPRIMVMCPQKYRSGYSATGALHLLQQAHGGVYWYKDKELVSCNVMKRARMRAQALRELRNQSELREVHNDLK